MRCSSNVSGPQAILTISCYLSVRLYVDENVFEVLQKAHKYRVRIERWNVERTETQVQIVIYKGVRIYVDSYRSKSTGRNMLQL